MLTEIKRVGILRTGRVCAILYGFIGHVVLSGLLTALVFSGTSGCDMGKPRASFKLAPRRITIHTEPQGAEVTQLHPLGQPSTPLGKTPINDLSVVVMTEITMKHMSFAQAQDLMRHAGNVVVSIRKEGYEPYVGTLRTDPNETAVHTIQLQPKNPG